MAGSGAGRGEAARDERRHPNRRAGDGRRADRDARAGRRMSAQGRALAQRMIDAHGGMARWERAASIDFDMSGGGLLLLSKGQRGTMDAVRVSVATTGQRTVIAPYPGPGRRGTFDTGSVLIE